MDTELNQVIREAESLLLRINKLKEDTALDGRLVAVAATQTQLGICVLKEVAVQAR